MDGICYIIGAGQMDDLVIEPSDIDFVIAADAGYLHLAKLLVVADLVVGDFDSLGSRPNHPNVLEYPQEKDQTDMMLAIDEGLCRGYKKFIILGGLGGRLDHTYANIQALSYITQYNARGYLLGSGTAVTVIKDSSISFDRENLGTISVFCCGDIAQFVTLKGLKYELNNTELKGSYPLGVSNAFIGVDSEISVLHGSLIIMWEEMAAKVIESLKARGSTASPSSPQLFSK